jgi:hypothetical protein
MPKPVRAVSLTLAWLAVAGSLVVLLTSQEWRACAGDPVPAIAWLALLGLIVASLAVMVTLASVINGPLRPVVPFLVGLALCALTGGAVIAAFVVFLGHFADVCNGG